MSLDLLRASSPTPLAPARRFSALPVSILVHVLLLVAVVVIPLVATDTLPMVASAGTEWAADYTPVVPQIPPPRGGATKPAPIQEAAGTSIPVVAPVGIHDNGIERAPVEPQTGLERGVMGGEAIGAGLASVVVDTPPPPPPQPTVVAPVRVIHEPRRIVDVRPVYPEMARMAHVEGVVIIEAVVGADGAVRDARVLRSHPMLNEAALDAVRQWRYTPTLLNGNPVPVLITVTVNFKLR